MLDPVYEYQKAMWERQQRERMQSLQEEIGRAHLYGLALAQSLETVETKQARQYKQWLASLQAEYPSEQYKILTKKTPEGYKAQIISNPKYIQAQYQKQQQEMLAQAQQTKGAKPFTWAWLGESLYKTRMFLETFDPITVGREFAEKVTGREMTLEQEKKHREIAGIFSGDYLEEKYRIRTGYKAIEEFKYAGISFLPLPRPTPELGAVGLAIGHPEWMIEYGELVKKHPGYLIGDIAQLYLLAKGVYKAGKWVKGKVSPPKTKYYYWEKYQSELGKSPSFVASEEDWGRFYPQMQQSTSIGAFERAEGTKAWRVIQKIYPTQKGGGLLVVEESYPELQQYLSRLHKLKPFQYAPYLMETTTRTWPTITVFSTVAVSRSVMSSMKLSQPTKPELKLPSETELRLFPKTEEKPFAGLKLPSIVVPEIVQAQRSAQETVQRQSTRQRQITKQRLRQVGRVPHYPSPQKTSSESSKLLFPTFDFSKSKLPKKKDLFGAWFKRERHIKTPEQMIKTYMNMEMPKLGGKLK